MGGCDTIITLNLTVTPYLTGTEAVTICQGQSYIFNGVTYTSSNNNAKDTVQNLSGCDSIVTLNLTVNPYLIGTRTINICYGESYTFNGVTYTTSNNTAKDTIPSPTGCDSIITLNLTVAPFLTGIRTVVLCAGDSYTFNGVTYTTSNNTATDTIQNSSGCDSLVTLDLTILPPLSSIDRRNICFGESYLFNGSTYTTSNNTARDTFISTNGCDSIVTLNLSVSSPVNFLTIDTSGCGSITIDGTTYTTSIFVNDTIRGIAGCDSLYINYNILIYPNYNLRTNIDSVSCDSVLFEGTTYYADTSFVQMFNTVNGCDSLQRTVNIDIDDFELDLNADLLQPYEGEVITLTATTNIPYYQVISWEPSSLFLDQQAKAQWVKLYENTQITVTAISPNGCIDTASLDFNTLDITHTVSFPNAFTPNGDGRNDIFKPLVAIKRAYLVKYFRIVNRWGQEVFHQISQNVEGWDGTFKGVPQGMGVYNYYFEIEFVDGKKIQMKGDVTLVR